MNRAAEIAGFLETAGWADADIESMPADFSPRRYARLLHADGCHAILMDADKDQKTPQFVALAKVLLDLGLSAPEIYAQQALYGLVLMEDFGEANVGRLIDGAASAELYYLRAAEVLVHLHRSFRPEMISGIEAPHFTVQLFTQQTEKFLDNYVSYAVDREASATERDDFRAAWLAVLQPVVHMPQSLLLRDFMPDNVMHLSQREGVRALGLLDFQDAGMGPVAYDMASFCETVRRDGGDVMLQLMITRYMEITRPSFTAQDLAQSCRILSAQRHMRILGILADLAVKGREDKRDYMPRVQKRLQELLRDEALLPVRQWLDKTGFLNA
jgi:aminoglycoside/choline kinase family phosphotransferase